MPPCAKTMQAFWIVKHLDVVEHISARILLGAIDLSTDSFPIQQLGTALLYRIVMAVATPTHTAKQVVG